MTRPARRTHHRPVITRPRPLPAPRPLLVPGPPLATPNPFALQSPFAALANPFAGTDPFAAAVRDPFAPAAVLDPFQAGTKSPFALGKNPLRRVISRTHIVMPPFGPRPARRQGWTLSLKWVSEQDEQPGCPRFFTPGDRWDFSDYANWLAQFEHNMGTEDCGYGPEDFDEDGMVSDDHLHHCRIEHFTDSAGPWWGWEDELVNYWDHSPAAEACWAEYFAMWGAARREILDDPEAALAGSLGSSSSFQVMQCAGYEFPPGFYGSSGLANTALEALEADDDSVRAALPDVLLQAEAQVMGHFENLVPLSSVSRPLHHLGHVLEEQHELYPIDAACSQFFVFTELHEHVAPKNFPDVEGRYVVIESDYHSLHEQPHANAPMGMVGWGESFLVPADAEFQPMYSPGGSVQGTLF